MDFVMTEVGRPLQGVEVKLSPEGELLVRSPSMMIVLSISEKVNPNTGEAEITCDRLFKQVVMVGDRRPLLVAVIVLNADAWRRFAADNGLDPERPNHAVSKTELLARVTPLLTGLPRYGSRRALDTGVVDDRGWATDANPQGQKRRRAENVRTGDHRFV